MRAPDSLASHARMDPHDAADEFAVRYYRWALDDAVREVREGFPLVRAVTAGLAIRAVAHLESFTGDRRLAVAAALVKRGHRRGVELAGDSWGPAEDQIGQDYVQAVRIARPEEEVYRRALLSDPGTLTIERSRFLQAIRGELGPILGSGEPFSTPHEWRYDTPLGPWTLVTLVDVGGRQHQLAYTQTIRATIAHPLREGISLWQWLGLGGQTMWNQLVEGNTPAAARSLARICAHFLRAAPSLVAGLSPE